LEARIQGMDKERKQGKDQTKRIGQLNLLVERLLKEKTTLQERLIALQNKEDDATNELLRLDKRKVILERTNLEKMYRWLAVHQNSRTGLVASFEGDSDIAGWAFIYDQSLAAQAYMLFLDFERAKKLLTFFDKKAKRIDGRFVNAYYVSDGSPAEYSVHSGPNIWVGIAALHYTTKAKDTRFLSLAEQIAQAIIYLQNQDPEGGIRGGPGLPWYSTEHNLDAYAFFSMLYTITGKEDYRKARDKTLDWLLKHTYDKGDIPIKRGKGDATIATDTYAWSIASIGPQKLEDLQMNPDKIVEFAEQNCEVGVEYTRPDGTSVRVKGFDFAPQRHLARGGIVSSEWTAQMVITFRIMADFYYKKNMIAKARSYEQKADAYLGELSKMLIWSPSPTGQGEGCLPYASQDCVDTGHGWLTPKGKNTGSIAGTAYTLFAYSKYNPLELRKDRR
jgi:hypothetical protein